MVSWLGRNRQGEARTTLPRPTARKVLSAVACSTIHATSVHNAITLGSGIHAPYDDVFLA